MKKRLINRNSIIVFNLVILTIINYFLFSSNLLGIEYKFQNKSKKLTLIYESIKEADINLTILTNESNAIYDYSFKADYYGIPKVDFMDLNEDMFDDVILRLSSEGEYDLLVLININNERFVNGLSDYTKHKFTFNYDIFNEDLYQLRSKNECKEFYLDDINHDGTKELIFHHLFIDGKLSKNVIFYFNKCKDKLVLDVRLHNNN